ncbi:serine/threonine-protein kinase [Eubacteriales bacterium OttesenSCG-928-A19]|nr:serine/threonine-protein kinase [Eubacteriales bacterium OttesenSCG-928-A19]
MIEQRVGAITFTLRDAFDFAFLDAYGIPFAVFDQQDSGNLCFGVEGKNGRVFLKTAGPSTVRSLVTPDDAVRRLQSTATLYEALRHSSLTPMLAHHAIPGGYLIAHEWFDGVSLGRQYGGDALLRKLSFEERHGIFDTALAFHRHVHALGYVAIDFYDGSLMYAPRTRTTMICDIEFYRKAPAVNDMGRMWGSERFMSPEEHALGAPIDAVTNIYCMGAMAFHLFGGSADHARTLWQDTDAAYRVAQKATSPERKDRYPSIERLMEAWQNAHIDRFTKK